MTAPSTVRPEARSRTVRPADPPGPGPAFQPAFRQPAPSRGDASRERLLAAALDLFAEHGVSGTSLQMIADSLGVTKAAVYHHYRSKDDIILAVVAPLLAELTDVVETAEAKRSRTARAEAAVTGLVDLIIRNRPLYATLRRDPTIARVLQEHQAFPELGQRLIALLAGPDPDAGSLIATHILLAGLSGMNTPELDTIDSEELRQHLLSCARRLLRLRHQPAAGS